MEVWLFRSQGDYLAEISVCTTWSENTWEALSFCHFYSAHISIPEWVSSLECIPALWVPTQSLTKQHGWPLPRFAWPGALPSYLQCLLPIILSHLENLGPESAFSASEIQLLLTLPLAWSLKHGTVMLYVQQTAYTLSLYLPVRSWFVQLCSECTAAQSPNDAFLSVSQWVSDVCVQYPCMHRSPL